MPKFATTVAVALACISFANGCSTSGGDAVDRSTTTSTASTTTTQAGSSTTIGSDEVAREVGRYQPRRFDERIYLLVPKGITDEQLIDAATTWHEREPEADLQFFDDDAEIPTILELLPKTERGDLTDFPSEWVQEHQVARLQRFVNTDKAWKLGRGSFVDYEDTLAEFD